jgi:mRNA interferase HicA
MNSNEFKRWLAKQGCTFDSSEGKGGHIKVYRKGHVSILPMHGKKELGTGLVEAIKKQLGLKKVK